MLEINMFSGASQIFWINLAGFQLIWWLCILLGNTSLPIVLFLLVLHVVFHSQPLQETLAIFSCAIFGFVVDLLLTSKGLFIFNGSSSLPPIWLFALWLGFSATLRQSLDYFSSHYVLAAFLGAIGGSAAYLAAEAMGAVEFGASELYMATFLAFIWFLLFPLLSWLSHLVTRIELGHA